MEAQEARELVLQALPNFASAGLPTVEAEAIVDVQVSHLASLWAGMGQVYRLTVRSEGTAPVAIVAKRVQLPKQCSSIGDQRKKDSYAVEAAFYMCGHALRCLAAGAVVPHPLHVAAERGDGVTICMTQLEGTASHRDASRAFCVWLARFHATYWGARADEAPPAQR